MTRKQTQRIEWLKKEAERCFFYGDKYEFKAFEVKELECGIVSVVIECGMIGDEGTMAQWLCRDRVHVFVGERGGITYPTKNANSKSLGRHSLYTVRCAQR